ncbi:hypothetical protein A2982_00735 [candidate division WWE3 bacterium RIFCSPLOWO2_01_FULL_39_13]|uniref:Uncharacterized protein n=1 Tax=candidate division WWE3 bacterium RIFCSPLOWO2_01_FULL_39_13 TaxID=1802624 RepID=A0A1F4V5G6_UNCKA|nr:MAG: hypothetical protein A2982_00735 [candidate division WWE3 bacterium RIFCSPLOWO2_01_FULL_39_13]
MKSLIIKSYKQNLQVSGDGNLLSRIVKNPFFVKYIPSVLSSKMTSQSSNVIQFNLRLKISNSTCFDFDQKCATYSFSESSETTIKDIITIIDYCFDYLRAKDDVYCLHASSSVFSIRSVMFIGGASGIGKSMVNMSLVRNYNYSFLSDEKTLLENHSIVGGLRSFIKNKEIHQSMELNLETKHLGSIRNKLFLVVQPVTCIGGEVYLEKWPVQKAEWHLYEELTRKIRGISRRVDNFTIPIQSIDTYELSRKRSRFANELATCAKFYTIYGDPNKVAEKINQLVLDL